VGDTLETPFHLHSLMSVSPIKAESKPDPAALAEKLGHRFAVPRLLEDALTHPSLAGSRARKKGVMPYERLEFLGDRVLGLAIAEWLYETYPNADEGEMAKRHAALVNREALRAVATEVGLGKFVRLARRRRGCGQ
jgi:ribonuclease-3